MYKGCKIIVVACALNEEKKVGLAIRRVPRGIADCILCVDDGSTDRTAEVAREAGAEVISLGKVAGVGAAIRVGLQYAHDGLYDIVVFMAGNNKDEPSEIPRLLDPICESNFDFVQGSRFLASGRYGGDMPAYRRFATRLHPLLMSVFSGKRLSESTNGFRAIRRSFFDDPRLHLNQRWLDQYEMEVYLLFKAITLGYRHTEVPCTKLYPPKHLGITKMAPVIGWWSILRPIFLLGLRIRN